MKEYEIEIDGKAETYLDYDRSERTSTADKFFPTIFILYQLADAIVIAVQHCVATSGPPVALKKGHWAGSPNLKQFPGLVGVFVACFTTPRRYEALCELSRRPLTMDEKNKLRIGAELTLPEPKSLSAKKHAPGGRKRKYDASTDKKLLTDFRASGLSEKQFASARGKNFRDVRKALQRARAREREKKQMKT